MVPWFSCFHNFPCLVEKERIELSIQACKASVIPFNYNPKILVGKERLELSILSALASKTSVYTIPPLAHFIVTSSLLPKPLSL